MNGLYMAMVMFGVGVNPDKSVKQLTAFVELLDTNGRWNAGHHRGMALVLCNNGQFQRFFPPPVSLLL